MATLTATASEARANFSQIASSVSETGQPITVFKNSKPWVEIVPSGFFERISEEIIAQEKYAEGKSTEERTAQEKSEKKINEEEDDAYIERVAAALRKSKQQFTEGKCYSGSDALFKLLKQKRPETWR